MAESEISRSPSKVVLCILLIVLGVGLVLTLILVPLSFGRLKYYQYGFRRRKTTGEVDIKHVYSGGLHLIGPDYEFKVFPADAHFESFNKIQVFAADRLQVEITASMQYFLRRDQLPILHERFDIHYRPILKNNAVDALKGAATLFTTREYIRKRDDVEKRLFEAVRQRLGGSCCEKDCQDGDCRPGCVPYVNCTVGEAGLNAEVRYFQLHELQIPNELNRRYLQSIVLKEADQTEQLKQDAQIARKETDLLARKIENDALEISQNATALSRLISSKVQAKAKAIVEQARSSGLKNLFKELGIADPAQKSAFDYLRTLKNQGQVRLAVGYNQYFAGPMK